MQWRADLAAVVQRHGEQWDELRDAGRQRERHAVNAATVLKGAEFWER